MCTCAHVDLHVCMCVYMCVFAYYASVCVYVCAPYFRDLLPGKIFFQRQLLRGIYSRAGLFRREFFFFSMSSFHFLI